MTGKAVAVVVGVAITIGSAAGAQTAPEARPTIVRRQNQPRTAGDQMRYQIGTMERVLETAVEHGASVWRDRLQALAPVQAMLLENARVRGYRLDDYGLFFDIDVPSLEMTLFTALQTLDQNGLGLQSALNQVRSYIQTQAANDPGLQQALKRIELQLPMAPGGVPDVPNARAASGSAAVSPNDRASSAAPDPILTNPEEVFRFEVMQAIIDALLDHSAALGVSEDEWLTVAVRRTEVRPRIGLDSNAQTFIARVRGADLEGFRTGQLSREDAIKRVEVKVF